MKLTFHPKIVNVNTFVRRLSNLKRSPLRGNEIEFKIREIFRMFVIDEVVRESRNLIFASKNYVWCY